MVQLETSHIGARERDSQIGATSHIGAPRVVSSTIAVTSQIIISQSQSPHTSASRGLHMKTLESE